VEAQSRIALCRHLAGLVIYTQMQYQQRNVEQQTIKSNVQRQSEHIQKAA